MTFGQAWSSFETPLAMAGIAMLVSIMAPTAVEKAQPAGAVYGRDGSDMLNSFAS